MINENGYINIKKKSGGGIDEDGYPIPPTSTWSDNIPCQFRVNQQNNKGAFNGESFKTASYEILINQQQLDSEQLRLFTIDGKELGEYSIIKPETLRLVQRVKIIV